MRRERGGGARRERGCYRFCPGGLRSGSSAAVGCREGAACLPACRSVPCSLPLSPHSHTLTHTEAGTHRAPPLPDPVRSRDPLGWEGTDEGREENSQSPQPSSYQPACLQLAVMSEGPLLKAQAGYRPLARSEVCVCVRERTFAEFRTLSATLFLCTCTPHPITKLMWGCSIRQILDIVLCHVSVCRCA